MQMTPEETNTVMNLIVGAITFVLGLFINPRKKKKQFFHKCISMSNICCCENPKRIINPYTDEVVYAACRTCNTCLNIRVKNWQDRIKKECTFHLYSAFITLTYDNDHLPYYQPTYIDEDNNYIWNSNRLDIDDEIVGNYPFHPVTHCEELDHNCVPHLCKQDVVKFHI